MKKSLLLWGCVLACSTALAGQPGAPEPGAALEREGLWVEGYVVQLEYNQRVLTVSGQQFHVPIDAEVKNAFGGSNSFSLLQPGQAVRVTFREEENGRIAYQIEALPEGQTPVQH